MTLGASDIDTYVARFLVARKSAIHFAGAPPAWDAMMLESIALFPIPTRVGAHDDIKDLDSAALRELAPLLIRLLQAQVTAEHLEWWRRVVAVVSRTGRHDRDALEALASLSQREGLPKVLDAHRHLIAAPLTFAVTESTLKTACAAFVDRDGKTIKQWSIQFDGKQRNYTVGKRVNRLGHLLALFRKEVAARPTNDALDRCEDELGKLPGEGGSYRGRLEERLDCWRNQLMHGERLWTARVPVMNSILGVLLLRDA